jgi:glucans biosynthesis protein C
MRTLESLKEKGKFQRHYYLDWLRVMAILIVFFVHCSKIFDYHTEVVFNTARSPFLSIFREFALLWIMPFFFVISGAAVYLASRFQKAGGFIKSKARRILIPSILVGTFVVNPPYVYIEKLFNQKTTSSFLDWYPSFFDGLYVTGGNFAPWGMGTHIWYLQFLFIYSLLLLPLFFRFRKPGKSVLEKISLFFEKPWALGCLFLPVSVIAAAFEYKGLSGIRTMGNWDPVSYLFFFAYGYIVYSNTKIQETIKKHSTVFLIIALSLTGLYLTSHFGIILKIQSVTRHDLATGAVLPLNHTGFAVVQAFRGWMAWCWCLALLGIGQRFLNFNNSVRTYANEAVLPFYLLHHSLIYIVGFYVIAWNTSIGMKFLNIFVLSFIVIMVIYEVLIRRMNISRILFGMATKPLEKAIGDNRLVSGKIKPTI